MTSYIDSDYYLNTYMGTVIKDEDDIEKMLSSASRHIDTLTFNRIVEIGFDNLTEFQQEIISEAICSLADFEYENQDLLSSPFTSYSINGVSASFGEAWNVEIQNGIAIPKSVYSLLSQTGLTCRRL